jgi:hypothetical protein
MDRYQHLEEPATSISRVEEMSWTGKIVCNKGRMCRNRAMSILMGALERREITQL